MGRRAELRLCLLGRRSSVVTAFTIAHSITLSLAALGVVTPAVAAHRIGDRGVGRAGGAQQRAAGGVRRPLDHRLRFRADPRLRLRKRAGRSRPARDSLVLALVAFNVGVELGQLAIVAVFLPVAYALRDTRLYRRGILIGGSLVVAALAAIWLVERVFNLSLF